MTALSLGDQARDERLNAVDRTPQVDSDRPLPIGMGGVLGWSGHCDAGIVEYDVHASKTRPALISERLNRGLVADVRRDTNDIRPGTLKSRDRLVQGGALDVSKNDLDPFASQRPGCREAYTTRAACDHSHFACEVLHCASLSDRTSSRPPPVRIEQGRRARSWVDGPIIHQSAAGLQALA